MVLAAIRRRYEAWGFNPRQMSAIIFEALLRAQVSLRFRCYRRLYGGSPSLLRSLKHEIAQFSWG